MQNSAEILIIDDTPDHIAFAGNLLRNEGYRVYAVTNGRAALNFLEKHHPDLIMLDIKMEEMDGLEVCRIIKQDSKISDIPIIFLTAETKPEVIKQGFELGGCDYVVKPFIREEYLARVKTHLNISRQNQALVAANTELNLFCSAVSHDLKSPLIVIKMLIAELKNELGADESEDVYKIMNMISDKSEKLTVMIERLLEFSKLYNVEPKMENLDIGLMAKEIFNELKSLEPERNVILQCDDLPQIKGDSILISMLLKNILSNSMKFTRYRTKAVINIKNCSNSDYTVISISDNGAGFDMAYSDKLFKVFHRLHDEDEFEGTGVGLALVDRIMRNHGGKVEAYGKIGEGAEFRLFFLK